jgi:hypothetical protein
MMKLLTVWSTPFNEQVVKPGLNLVKISGKTGGVLIFLLSLARKVIISMSALLTLRLFRMLLPLVKGLFAQRKRQRKRKEDVTLLWPLLRVLNLCHLLLKPLVVLARMLELSSQILQGLLPPHLKSGLPLRQDSW